jgi:deoxycytidylate deaminase
MGSDLSKYLKEDPDGWWVDRMYLQDAWRAARYSTAPRTQVGAVIVLPSVGVIMKSWNRIPDRLASSGYPKDGDMTYACGEHAERSVIFRTLDNSIPVRGTTMYTTWASCAECARAIIHFGIERVVTLRRIVEATPQRWDSSIAQGLEMMYDSGINLVGWSGDLGVEESIRFDSKYIRNGDLA